jgi:hypothetical protein
LELWAGVALAALYFNVFGHELPAATVEVTRDALALGFKAQATAALFVCRDAKV